MISFRWFRCAGIHIQPNAVVPDILGPSLGTEEVLVIQRAAEQAGLGNRIRVSSMLGTQRYT